MFPTAFPTYRRSAESLSESDESRLTKRAVLTAYMAIAVDFLVYPAVLLVTANKVVSACHLQRSA